MNAGQTLLDWLFPPRCVLCGTLLHQGERELCPGCRKQLAQLRRSILQEGRGFARCVSVFPYEGPVREAILQYKFQGRRSKARFFGQCMAQCGAEELSGAFDLVTWVPVHPLRRLSRGYDQARLLAEETCRCWKVRPQAFLRKRRHTAPNSGLHSASARRGNVLGAYRALHANRLQGKRVLLIDDVVTSGSTLSECARVLTEAGAESVLCLTLAAALPDAHR